MFKRVEYNAEGRAPFIVIFAILLREGCGNVVPVGIEVKVSSKLSRKQIAREIKYLPYFTAKKYLNRESFIKRWLAPYYGEKNPNSNKRIYILITPQVIVKEADAFREPAYVHAVIPLEAVLDWLSIRSDLVELLNTWDLVIGNTP